MNPCYPVSASRHHNEIIIAHYGVIMQTALTDYQGLRIKSGDLYQHCFPTSFPDLSSRRLSLVTWGRRKSATEIRNGVSFMAISHIQDK